MSLSAEVTRVHEFVKTSLRVHRNEKGWRALVQSTHWMTFNEIALLSHKKRARQRSTYLRFQRIPVWDVRELPAVQCDLHMTEEAVARQSRRVPDGDLEDPVAHLSQCQLELPTKPTKKRNVLKRSKTLHITVVLNLFLQVYWTHAFLHCLLHRKGYNFQERFIKDLWNSLWFMELSKKSRWTTLRTSQGPHTMRSELEACFTLRGNSHGELLCGTQWRNRRLALRLSFTALAFFSPLFNRHLRQKTQRRRQVHIKALAASASRSLATTAGHSHSIVWRQLFIY